MKYAPTKRVEITCGYCKQKFLMDKGEFEENFCPYCSWCGECAEMMDIVFRNLTIFDIRCPDNEN